MRVCTFIDGGESLHWLACNFLGGFNSYCALPQFSLKKTFFVGGLELLGGESLALRSEIAPGRGVATLRVETSFAGPGEFVRASLATDF